MPQSLLDQIEVTGTFRFPLPDGMKLVPVDSHGYEGESLTGRWWTMKDLREWCANKSVDWLKDNILENPRYSREIGAMERKGQIIHKGRGSAWKFKAKAMAEFLDKHGEELPW